MWIDSEAKRGWKILADHVNRLDRALKRRIDVAGLESREKAALKSLLMSHNEDWWNDSPEELKQALEG
ncbi:YwhD family protein [compost metagenome]